MQPFMTETAPKVLITREQYLADIKVRWDIHKYETNQLGQDLKNLVEYIKPYIHKTIEHVKISYQREFGPKTTM